ncbi:serine--tRNA synthetase-like protein Slimp [Bradysia coprophila]|uniref:serine--tRNA synthetase-like protein Slimp n=1 Tax=Bradysia coprophila TaxID=38358 RepID=UPI00187DC84E|nr:serine--tRNA synthetase-like protein Slimp [Bradysia coprophila]
MLLKLPLICRTVQRNASSFSVTGQRNHAGVKPYIDFVAKLHDKQKLEHNIRQRKLNIDLNELYLLRTLDLSTKRSELARLDQKIKDILTSYSNADRTAEGIESLLKSLKLDAAKTKTEFKALAEDIKAYDDALLEKFLDLPNDIHERTPLDTSEIRFSYSSQRSIDGAENHLDKVNYLEHHDPFCYFLKSDAAKCELQLPLHCKKMFRSFGFAPFSNPDFVRSILAEGAGIRLNDLLEIIEDDPKNKFNRLHLAGSGSMLSFLGFVTKLLVYRSRLPLKFVSSGKSFSLADTASIDQGLYSTCQTTNVQLFSMTIDESESLRQFDETLEQMIKFYQRLDRTFRVRYVTADELAQAEQFRADFEVYSPHRKCFVPMGHLSSYGDFISRRLLIAFKEDSRSKFKFSHLISGNVINVTRFIAILLEEKGALSAPAILSHFK